MLDRLKINSSYWVYESSLLNSKIVKHCCHRGRWVCHLHLQHEKTNDLFSLHKDTSSVPLITSSKVDNHVVQMMGYEVSFRSGTGTHQVRKLIILFFYPVYFRAIKCTYRLIIGSKRLFKIFPIVSRTRGYNTFFMLSSVEHEILNAHKYKKISRNSALLGLVKPRMEWYFFRSYMLKCQQLLAF